MAKIRIVVVEDSLTARAHLVRTLRSDPDCEVVGEAADGETGIRLCQTLRPDVMTLDMMLANGMSGLEVTEHVMAYCPTPIVIVSASFNRGELVRTFDALAAGAVEVVEKPTGREERGVWERNFLHSVKLTARIKVITHPRLRLRGLRSQERSLVASATTSSRPSSAHRYDLIAIGASTGGPGAVVEILRHALPAPVLLLIHIGKPFAIGLAEWLARVLPVPVVEAVDGQLLPPPGTSQVIVAAADSHMTVADRRLRLSDAPERNSCRPSIDVLFESVASHYGPRAIGCLLTGMGRDGAEGLLLMRQKGAATIAQDQSTAVVFGMPKEAIRLGAAQRVLRLPEIGPTLLSLCRAPRDAV
ncbi:MAG: chemotaxis protein CheB [Verrucomicrobiota bacterium]